jgi:transposase
LLGLVEQTPDMTIIEMQQRLAGERGVKASVGTIWTFLGLTFRKRLHTRRSGKLMFIDETGAATNMPRPRGRVQKGERLRAGIPQGHWKTTTFVAGLRLTGITAPMMLDGPMNDAAFLGYVQQVLMPALRLGDIVIMDNLSPTRAARCATPSRRPAQAFFLPPYGPDFNPTENAFVKLKTLLRKAGKRSVEGLWHLVEALLDAFSPQEYAMIRIKLKMLYW